jgi:hypothetical protein
MCPIGLNWDFKCYVHQICGLNAIILLSLVTRPLLIVPALSWGQFVWDLWWVKCSETGFPPCTKVFPSQVPTHLHRKSYSLKTTLNRKKQVWSLGTFQLNWCSFINQGASRNKCLFILILLCFKWLSKKCPHLLTFMLLWWVFKF